MPLLRCCDQPIFADCFVGNLNSSVPFLHLSMPTLCYLCLDYLLLAICSVSVADSAIFAFIFGSMHSVRTPPAFWGSWPLSGAIIGFCTVFVFGRRGMSDWLFGKSGGNEQKFLAPSKLVQS